jgi:hypothetical protein
VGITNKEADVKIRLKLFLVLGALVALAGVAYADFNTLFKGTYYQNATSGAKTDASGNAYTTESNPEMDANLTFAPEQCVNSVSLAAGSADSSGVMDTHRMRLGMLYIKCTKAATGVSTTSRLAISIRGHLNGQSDSSSVFPVFFYGRSDQGVTAIASQLDTTSTGQLVTGSASNPWSGEYVIVVDHLRGSPADGVAAVAFQYPNGIALPLSSIFGREIYNPYTSIRVRNLSGPTVNVSISLVGTPL